MIKNMNLAELNTKIATDFFNKDFEIKKLRTIS